MAPDTRQRLTPWVRALDRLHDVAVALPARLLGDRGVARRDPQRLRKSAGGEGDGVMESVGRFGHVLGDEAWRRMAVVARRDRVMRTARPRPEMVIHDVAV